MKITKDNAQKHITNKLALEHVIKCLERGDELYQVTRELPKFKSEYVVTSDYGIIVRKLKGV